MSVTATEAIAPCTPFPFSLRNLESVRGTDAVDRRVLGSGRPGRRPPAACVDYLR